MSTKKENNSQLNQIKTVQGRWMTTDEEIYVALDIYSMSLYTALRYEGDFAQESSKVNKSTRYLYERAKISRRQCFKSLNILESYGLIKRENEDRLGDTGCIYVSKHMNYFKEPVHTVHGVVHTVHEVVHTVHTYKESLQEPSQEKEKIYKQKESEQEKINQQKNNQQEEKEMLQLPSPKINEDETMINPDFEYQETLFPMTTISEQINTQSISLRQQYNLTPHQEDTFEMFWEIYPNKKQKNRVKCLWHTQGCHLNAEAIISKLKEQTLKDACFLEGYAPSASNYIMDERWDDEIQIRKKKSVFDHQDKTWAEKRDIFD